MSQNTTHILTKDQLEAILRAAIYSSAYFTINIIRELDTKDASAAKAAEMVADEARLALYEAFGFGGKHDDLH